MDVGGERVPRTRLRRVVRRKPPQTAVALRGAIDLIAQAGGGVVEGYPHDTTDGKKVSVLPLSLARDGSSILAWAVSPLRKPQGDLVRVTWDGRRTTLVKDADQLADWNF